MHQLQHQKISKIFTKSFTKLDAFHLRNTRQKQSRDYFFTSNNHVIIFLPRVNEKFSQNL